jgi:hypothetical protein
VCRGECVLVSEDCLGVCVCGGVCVDLCVCGGVCVDLCVGAEGVMVRTSSRTNFTTQNTFTNLREFPLADVTSVWLLACVHPHV